jgi:micrococcal nuclease
MRKILLSLLLLASPAHAETLRVVDGDTFVLNGERVRILGIDAPEKNQPYGHEATQMLRALLADPVTLERKGKDRYGRTLAHVYTARGVDVGGRMLAQGYAWCWEPCSIHMLTLEWMAKGQGRGLWSGDAVRPTEWRAGR